MSVQGFRHPLVLSPAVVFLAELEALHGGSVVEVEHSGVLSEAVQDDFAHVGEESNTG